MQLNRQVGGSGLREKTPPGPQNNIQGKGSKWVCTWDTRCCRWALWKCCGPIIETAVRKIAHQTTPDEVSNPNHTHTHTHHSGSHLETPVDGSIVPLTLSQVSELNKGLDHLVLNRIFYRYPNNTVTVNSRGHDYVTEFWYCDSSNIKIFLALEKENSIVS